MTGPRIGELFAGYGGLGMAVQQVYGGHVAWYSEFDPAPSKIMAHHHPHAPSLGDVTQIDWQQVEPVDILTGGFPCQDVSQAGRRAGMKPGTRSGLWAHMRHAIDQLRPGLVVIENVRGLFTAEADSRVEPCPLGMGASGGGGHAVLLRALDAVLGDLTDLGYDAEWTTLRASEVGGAHGRARVFITAHPVSIGSGGRPDLTITRCARGAHAAAHRPDSRPYPPREPARLMPTPGANLGTNGGAQHPNKRRAGGHQVSIQDVARGLVEDHASSFGPYAPAISRWEQTIGRPAPPPTQPGRSRPQLSASFVEWLMGLPDGHVTGAPGLTRSQQLKALGNGVMPQQGAEALRRLHEARGL